MPPALLKCVSCLRLRSPTELLAFWPAGDPARRRFVCRPTLDGRCFRAEVPGPGFVIGPA